MREGGLVEAAVMLEAVPGARLQLVEVPAGLGDADDRHVDALRRAPGPAATGRSACRRDRRWRRRRRARRRARRLISEPPAGFSWWPPNSKRIADSSLSAYSASPRDSKRANSAALSTGAGTPSSIAACSVQRPSPESDTRPAKFAEVGSSRSARGGQVEQPRADHAAAPPDLGDLGDVDLVAIELGMAQRRRLGVRPPASRARHWRGAGC